MIPSLQVLSQLGGHFRYFIAAEWHRASDCVCDWFPVVWRTRSQCRKLIGDLSLNLDRTDVTSTLTRHKLVCQISQWDGIQRHIRQENVSTIWKCNRKCSVRPRPSGNANTEPRSRLTPPKQSTPRLPSLLRTHLLVLTHKTSSRSASAPNPVPSHCISRCINMDSGPAFDKH